jgi:hypothetical protein
MITDFNFIPSAELLEAIRIITGIDPFDDVNVIRSALRDPATAASIERLRKVLVARQGAARLGRAA